MHQVVSLGAVKHVVLLKILEHWNYFMMLESIMTSINEIFFSLVPLDCKRVLLQAEIVKLGQSKLCMTTILVGNVGDISRVGWLPD